MTMIPAETFSPGYKGQTAWADGRLGAPCETIGPIGLDGVAPIPF